MALVTSMWGFIFLEFTSTVIVTSMWGFIFVEFTSTVIVTSMWGFIFLQFTSTVIVTSMWGFIFLEFTSTVTLIHNLTVYVKEKEFLLCVTYENILASYLCSCLALVHSVPDFFSSPSITILFLPSRIWCCFCNHRQASVIDFVLLWMFFVHVIDWVSVDFTIN